MKDKILDDQALIPFLTDFFGIRNKMQHLRFVEEWLQLVMTSNFYTKRNNPADILYFHDLFVELYQLLFQLSQDQTAFEKLNVVISGNCQQSSFYSNLQYLSEEEIVNPLLVINDVFKDHDFAFYKAVLRDWLEESLNSGFSDGISESIFPLYANTKRIIEACWILHHGVKESDLTKETNNTPICFEQTCPRLLQESHLIDPYMEIESFFSGTSLGEYRKDLKDWFRAALIEHVSLKHSSTIVYFHDQLVQLLHAGYLIVNNNLEYKRNEAYCSNALTFRDWINGVKAKRELENGVATSDFEVYALSDKEKLGPLQYLSKILKLKKIKEIRYGMQEWLYCALSNKSSLMGVDDKYILKLYETLEKLLEAFFLLVAGNDVKVEIIEEGQMS